jgi:hypothetical protein
MDCYGSFKPFIYSSNLDNANQKVTPLSSLKRASGRVVDDTQPNDIKLNGAQLTFGRSLTKTSSADLTLLNLNSNASFVPSLIGSPKALPSLSNGNLITAIVMDGFRRSLPESMEYDTEFIGAELSYRYKAAALWSFMSGFRYMYLGEELNQSAPGSRSLQSNGLHGVEAESHYFGAQIGADFATSLRDNLAMSGDVKLAGFVNVAENTTLLLDNDGNSLTYKNSDTRIATLVEGNFSMDWLINPNMSLSAGYSAVFMGKVSDGAAIAHDQTAAGFKYQDTDNVLFHGPVLNFKFTW